MNFNVPNEVSLPTGKDGISSFFTKGVTPLTHKHRSSATMIHRYFHGKTKKGVLQTPFLVLQNG